MDESRGMTDKELLEHAKLNGYLPLCHAFMTLKARVLNLLSLYGTVMEVQGHVDDMRLWRGALEPTWMQEMRREIRDVVVFTEEMRDRFDANERELRRELAELRSTAHVHAFAKGSTEIVPFAASIEEKK